MTAAITDRVHAIARAISRRAPEEAEDLLQEGLLGAWQAIPRYNGRVGTLAGWCSLRARGAMHDYLRRVDPLTRQHREAIQAGRALPIRIVSLDYLPYSERCKI